MFEKPRVSVKKAKTKTKIKVKVNCISSDSNKTIYLPNLETNQNKPINKPINAKTPNNLYAIVSKPGLKNKVIIVNKVNPEITLITAPFKTVCPNSVFNNFLDSNIFAGTPKSTTAKANAKNKICKNVYSFPDNQGIKGLIKKANITILNAVLLNKTYETVFNEARRDRKIIDNFCPQERVDELLRQEELKNKLIE